MIIRCLNFGSLWWLRPGDCAADPFRFSSHAAVFNTTGFCTGTRERRCWHVPGIVRLNAGVHGEKINCRNLMGETFESPGTERRGAWNRLLIGRRISGQSSEKILICVSSTEVGRIDFDKRWCGSDIEVVAASAYRGDQETLLLASPSAELMTNRGMWRLGWNGFSVTK